jgi:hypothetical protein
VSLGNNHNITSLRCLQGIPISKRAMDQQSDIKLCYPQLSWDSGRIVIDFNKLGCKYFKSSNIPICYEMHGDLEGHLKGPLLKYTGLRTISVLLCIHREPRTFLSGLSRDLPLTLNNTDLLATSIESLCCKSHENFEEFNGSSRRVSFSLSNFLICLFSCCTLLGTTRMSWCDFGYDFLRASRAPPSFSDLQQTNLENVTTSTDLVMRRPGQNR